MSTQEIIPLYHTYALCSGKSGSSTIWKTLLDSGYSSLHVHGRDYYSECLKLSGDLYNDSIDKSVEHFNKVYIIDSYRTPIERKISSYFQNLQLLVPNYEMKIPKELINIFNETYLKGIENYQSINEALDHYSILRWTSFDFRRGYNLKEVDNKIFIKVRFADIKNWGNIFSKIFKKPIRIVNENISETKKYAEIYKEFKRQYKVPRSFLEELKSDVEFNIYTTPKERDEYFAYWYARSTD